MILEMASPAEALRQMVAGSQKNRRFLKLEWSSNRHLGCADALVMLLKIALYATPHGESSKDIPSQYK